MVESARDFVSREREEKRKRLVKQRRSTSNLYEETGGSYIPDAPQVTADGDERDGEEPDVPAHLVLTCMGG